MSDIYWNTHKNCWSVRQKGRVVAHARSLKLADCQFVVSEKGRQKVLREQKKYVHAVVRGRVVGGDFIKKAVDLPEGGEVTLRHQQIRYNPYDCKYFQTLDGQPVFDAASVEMLPDRTVWR